MTNEPRKATDILLSLENEIKQLTALVRNQDLVMKVLANKLNGLVGLVEHLSTPDSTDSNSQSEIYNPHNLGLPPDGEFKLPEETNPKGFRRTSRPETFQARPGVKPSPPKAPVVPPPKAQAKVPDPAPKPTYHINLPVQFPEFKPSIAPATYQREQDLKAVPVNEAQAPEVFNTENKIPVQQRLVDKNGKAVFLANVEIINAATGNSETTVRTNSVGKWQAPLTPGHYRVKINKQESLSKEKIDLTQNITVDGQSPTQELPVLICK